MKRKSSIFKHIATMLFAVGTVAAPLAAHADTNFVVDGNFTNLTPGDYQPYFAGQTFGGTSGTLGSLRATSKSSVPVSMSSTPTGRLLFRGKAVWISMATPRAGFRKTSTCWREPTS